MNLLVTNDDGIDSSFLRELVAALRRAGHSPFVVAPQSEQSWIGAAKTRGRPIKSAAVDRGLDCPAWTVEGTPSDCVNIGLAYLVPCTIDGVVSGINVSSNCSLSFILASGTVAGAWEGALHGLPAMAVSQDMSEAAFQSLQARNGHPAGQLLATLQTTAAHAARLAGDLLPATPPRSFLVHNLNFPQSCRPDSPVCRTVPAQYFAPGLFSPAANDGTHRMIWTAGEDASPAHPLTDLACLAAGHISHSVLDYRRLGGI